MAGPSAIDIHVSKRLKKLRVERGLSQAVVAEVLGVSHQQYRKYEIADNRLAAARLFQLSRYFNVPISYFFTGLNDNELPAVLEPDELKSKMMKIWDRLDDSQKNMIMNLAKTCKSL